MKSRTIASLLALFGGVIGAHNLYLRRRALFGFQLTLAVAGCLLAFESVWVELRGLPWPIPIGAVLITLAILLAFTDLIVLRCQSVEWFDHKFNGKPAPLAPLSEPLPRGEWRYRSLLLILLGLIFIPFMGSFGLWDPWETHYGEVGRQMIERGDWVSTWWGSHWRDGNGGSEGRYFYSKPVLLMWMMGMGLEVFGFSEWGIRFGVGLITIVAGFMVYLMGREIWSRRTGTIMLLVISTSPFWAMLGRQSQTDMPFVGLMTAGLCLLLMGLFGKRRDEKATPFDAWVLLVSYLIMFIPQMQLIWVKFGRFREELPSYTQALFRYGPVLVGIYSVAVFLVLVWFLFFKKRKTKRDVWMLGFYIFIALATLAKGVLGFALPGAIILVYILVSREWYRLKEVRLVSGIIVFATICFPWYMAMFLRHGKEYWNRFFVHDHLRRLASGVHQTDNGSFEHFIKWLGYGLFPWASFLPAALARVTVGREVGSRTDAQRARLLLVIWFIVSFTLFTMSTTKFHHYIFPCVPAIAMLVALYLDDVLTQKVKSFFPLYLTAFALFVLVGFDLFSEPQNLKNLFTYQYDRMWEETLTPNFISFLKVIFAVGLVGFAFLAIRTKAVQTFAMSILLVCSTSLTVWCLDVYMPNLAVDWSQGYLWDTYYSLCTPIDAPTDAPRFKRYCAEPIIAYKLNWRGETYYTQNEVIPVEDDSDFTYFLRQNDDRSFYAIMQHPRLSSFRSALPEALRPGISQVHTENKKFILVRVLNGEGRDQLASWLEVFDR